MSSSQQLYQQVFNKLRAAHPSLHLKRLNVWVWVIVGLILWLASKWIVSRQLYDPLIGELLKAWSGREVTIILDGCFVRHKALQMLRLSLSHCYRALPLGWEVVTTKGNVELEVCEKMLDYAATLLHSTRRVTFLADRGFRDRAWARKCRKLGWDYIIRIANNTTITFTDGRQVTAEELGIKKGKCCYLTNVRLTLEADWSWAAWQRCRHSR
jgi:hypothetical protein